MVPSEPIQKYFGDNVDLVIDVGDLDKAKPSTVMDLSSSKPSLVRNGFDSDNLDSIEKDLDF